MSLRTTFIKPSLPSQGCIVVTAAEGNRLSPSAAELDKRLKGAIRKGMRTRSFKSAHGRTLFFAAPAGISADGVLLVGLGKPGLLDAESLSSVGGTVAAALERHRATEAFVHADMPRGVSLSPAEAAARIAYGMRLRSYRFDRYQTRMKDEEKRSLSRVSILAADPAAARRKFLPLNKVADGVFLTRDLVSEPANILNPAALAAEARKLKSLGIEVEVLQPARLKNLGMGALLGVGQGSVNTPRVVTMRWRGKKSQNPSLALVGKGVTFDTGGISIKPSNGMEDMKWDMGGAGVVIGTMKALAGRKAKAHIVGVVGLVENMPSGNAQRPGDVVKSMSGQTIEVINTDAEGRLVLADALWHAQKHFRPARIIDLATLTGAILVALGQERAGLFSNDDKLSKQLGEAGDATGEKVWRMPLDPVYREHIRSKIADMKNLGMGRYAGSIAAAVFLERFIDGIPWAHLDIAGVTWKTKAQPLVPEGGTAFGVRLLERFISDSVE